MQGNRLTIEQSISDDLHNIRMLLDGLREGREEFPSLRGPLRVYGPPSCKGSARAALSLSFRYLQSHIAAQRRERDKAAKRAA